MKVASMTSASTMSASEPWHVLAWAGVLSVFASAFAGMTSDARAAEEVNVTDTPPPAGQYDLSLRNSLRATQGSFDPYGVYHGYPDGSKAWGLTSQLGA